MLVAKFGIMSMPDQSNENITNPGKLQRNWPNPRQIVQNNEDIMNRIIQNRPNPSQFVQIGQNYGQLQQNFPNPGKMIPIRPNPGHLQQNWPIHGQMIPIRQNPGQLQQNFPNPGKMIPIRPNPGHLQQNWPNPGKMIQIGPNPGHSQFANQNRPNPDQIANQNRPNPDQIANQNKPNPDQIANQNRPNPDQIANQNKPNPDQIANQNGPSSRLNQNNEANLSQKIQNWPNLDQIAAANENGPNPNQINLNEPNPDELVERGRLGQVRILLPRKYQDRAVQIKFTDKLIIRNEDGQTRHKFFKPKQPPCYCEDCANDRTCACRKLSKLRIKDGKLVEYNVKKIVPWNSPIVPCDVLCECQGECGLCPVPIDPKRMYIGYNEKTQFGLYADELILRGEMIGEYVGEVLLDGEHKNLEHSFMVPLDDGTNSDETDYALIDSSRYGNHTAMANHSCSPSAEAVYYYVPNADFTMMHLSIGIFATRRINQGDEITINYGKDYWEDKQTEGFHCECGSSICFEKIGWLKDDDEIENETSADESNELLSSLAAKEDKISDQMSNISGPMPEISGQMPDISDNDSLTSEQKLEQLIAQVYDELEQEMGSSITSKKRMPTNEIGKKSTAKSSKNNAETGANRKVAAEKWQKSDKNEKNKQIMQSSDYIVLDSDDDVDSNQIPWAGTSKLDKSKSTDKASTSKSDKNASADKPSSNHLSPINHQKIKQNMLKMQKTVGKMKGVNSNKSAGAKMKQHQLKIGGAKNDAKKPRMDPTYDEKGKGKMEKLIGNIHQQKIIVFEPNSDYLVSEIRRVFWLSMEPFGITASQNMDDALKIFKKNLSTINPAIVIKQLNDKFLVDNFVKNTQIVQRIEHLIEILFNTRIFSSSVKQTASQQEAMQKQNGKALLFFYVCLFRKLVGFLGMPYVENAKIGTEINELSSFINNFPFVIMQELIKNMGKIENAEKEEFGRKLGETRKFEEQQKLVDVMYLVIYGIQVVMTPLISEQITIFNEKGKFDKNLFEKLEQISNQSLIMLINQKEKENIVNLWHNVVETAKHKHFKKLLTIIPRINALINFVVAQRQPDELKLLADAKMYKLFFKNLAEFLKLGVSHATDENDNDDDDNKSVIVAWEVLNKFVKTKIEQLDDGLLG
ncbi:hypothetical protein niasHT_039594 [Heterodera trifolii]|uniref:SET domain-containing protein n=1 Tax=Heterodera trifolii TaxID=157864 RepID=A0ABD2I0P8_9BILA